MNKLYKIIIIISVFICSLSSFSQSDQTQIIKDNRIDSLLKLKKEINKELFNLKIQIFSGKRDKALEIMRKHNENNYKGIKIELVYETPNYKLWLGDFYTQLEADRKLIIIKKEYPEAFIFKPKPKIEKNSQVELKILNETI